MNKKYLSRIIAKDSQGLKLISACCFQATLRVSELRYLKKNQIFLSFLQRYTRENNNEKINSVCKFEFVESVKSKNIFQNGCGTNAFTFTGQRVQIFRHLCRNAGCISNLERIEKTSKNNSK